MLTANEHPTVRFNLPRKNGVLPERCNPSTKEEVAKLEELRRNAALAGGDHPAKQGAAKNRAKPEENWKLPKPNDPIDPYWRPTLCGGDTAANGLCTLQKKKLIVHRNTREEAMYGYMSKAYAKWAAPHEAIFTELERIATAIDLMVDQFGFHDITKIPMDETSKAEREMFYEMLLKAMAEAFKQFGIAGDGLRLRELHVIYSHMLNDANPTMLAVKEYMESQGGQMESGECLVNRCRWLMSSAMDCVKMATEMEWRRQLFDCSGAMRNAITLLRRELGWRVRSEYNRRFYTLPAIAYCYVRKMRGECICTEGCKLDDPERIEIKFI